MIYFLSCCWILHKPRLNTGGVVVLLNLQYCDRRLICCGPIHSYLLLSKHCSQNVSTATAFLGQKPGKTTRAIQAVAKTHAFLRLVKKHYILVVNFTNLSLAQLRFFPPCNIYVMQRGSKLPSQQLTFSWTLKGFGTCYFHYSYSRQVHAEATRERHWADVVMYSHGRGHTSEFTIVKLPCHG